MHGKFTRRFGIFEKASRRRDEWCWSDANCANVLLCDRIGGMDVSTFRGLDPVRARKVSLRLGRTHLRVHNPDLLEFACQR